MVVLDTLKAAWKNLDREILFFNGKEAVRLFLAFGIILLSMGVLELFWCIEYAVFNMAIGVFLIFWAIDLQTKLTVFEGIICSTPVDPKTAYTIACKD